MMPRRSSDSELLTELARHMMSVSMWTGRYYDSRFEPLGLTPASVRALLQLDPVVAVPSRELALRMSCDASNVTGLVDRLEDAGLVERRVDPTDRRVKTLAVTARGRRMRERMTAIMAADSPSMEALTATEQKTLLELLRKSWEACQAHDAIVAPSEPQHR